MHLRSLLLAAIALVAASAAVLPSPASARRAPTDAERSALFALDPSGCAVAAELSDDGRWALVTVIGCRTSTPTLLVAARDAAGGPWRVAARAETMTPVCSVDLAAVPAAVVAELVACETDQDAIALAEVRRDVYGELAPECVVTVERSRRDSSYASAELLPGDDCSGHNGGYQIVRRTGGRWRLVADASQGVECTVPGARAIPRDLLSGCIRVPPRRVYLACIGKRYPTVVLSRRPRTCSISDPNLPVAADTPLVRLRWSSWGGAKARARGFLRPSRQYGDERPRPVTVVAYQQMPYCGTSSPHYSRLRIVAPRFSQIVRIGDLPPRRVTYRAGSWVVNVVPPTTCAR